MREFLSAVSPKGQITIPAEIRRELGIMPKDKVTLRMEEGALRVVPARFTLEDAYGSVTPRDHPEDFEAISDMAKAEHASSVVRKLSRR